MTNTDGRVFNYWRHKITSADGSVVMGDAVMFTKYTIYPALLTITRAFSHSQRDVYDVLGMTAAT